MRRLVALFGALVLVAGCASGSGGSSKAPTPAQATPVATTVAPTADPTAKPTPVPTPALVSSRLTFDGKVCTYTGPTVVTVPATLSIEFAPTREAYALNIAMVRDSATVAEVKAADDPSYGPAPDKQKPDWLLSDSWHVYWGTGTATYDLGIVKDGSWTYDQFSITCVRHEWTDDQPTDTVEGRMFGALIKLLPAK